MQGEWLRVGEAARRLRLSPQRVRQLIDQGKLTAIRTPLGRLVDANDCARLVRERQSVYGNALQREVES